MSSLRTLHTSLGSNKNNYQVISKGYYFSEDPKSPPQSDLLNCFSSSGDRVKGEGFGNQRTLLEAKGLFISEPQFLQT